MYIPQLLAHVFQAKRLNEHQRPARWWLLNRLEKRSDGGNGTSVTQNRKVYPMEDMTRATFLKLGGSLIAVGALAACSSSSKSQATGSPAVSQNAGSPAASQNATEQIAPYSGQIGATSYPSTLLSVPILIANEKGFFADQKLDLQMVVVNSATDLAHSLNSGEVSFGVGGILTVMSGFAAGLDKIRLIGQVDGIQYITFLTKASSPIKSPSDLKGKKIAVLTNTKNLSYWMALQMLKGANLTASDVQFVFLQSFPAVLAAVENGVVDVGASFKPVSTGQVVSGKARMVWDSGPNVVGYPDDGLFTNVTMTSDHAQVCQRVATAIIKAQDWVRSNTAEAASLWATAAKLDPKITTETLSGGVAESMTFPISQAGFERDRSLGVALGTVPAGLAYDAFVDPRFQQAVAQGAS